MSDISLHIDCTYRWEEAKQFIASPNIKSVLLFNTSPDQVDYTLQHCKFVVVRIYDPFKERGALGEDFEKSIVNRRPPQDFVAWLDASGFAKFKNDTRVRFELGWNELYSKRGQAEHDQNDNVTAIGQAMIDAGYGVALGGWASDKSIYADDVNAGHWDSVIKLAVNNPTMVSVDVHEYDVLTPFAGHLKQYPDGFPNTLKTAISLDPANHARIPYYRADGNIETNYKIGRVALLIQRSLDITGQEFNWFRGECAHDFKDDGALKDFIDNWYKPRYGHPTGINSLYAYYRDVLGISESEYDELIARQYTDLADQDPDSCQANFIFAWNGDSIRWLPFDVAQRPYFLSLIKQYTGKVSMPDTPQPIVFDPALYEADVYMASGTLNMRAGMTTNSTDLGDITQTPIRLRVSKKTNEANGYEWYKYKRELSTHEEVGYFADFDSLRIDYVTDDTAPDVPDDESPDTTPPTDGDDESVDREALKAELKAELMAELIAELTESVMIDIPVGDVTVTAPKLLLGVLGELLYGFSLNMLETSKQFKRADGQLLLEDLANDTFVDTEMKSVSLDSTGNIVTDDDLPKAS